MPNEGNHISKSKIKTILLTLGIVTWILLFFSNWLWFEVARSPFTTKVYDVSRRMTSPDGKRSVLLVRDFAFDLNFRLFSVDDVGDPAPVISRMHFGHLATIIPIQVSTGMKILNGVKTHLSLQ